MHGSYVRGTTDRNYPPWADKIVTTCMSYLTTGGLGKKQGTNKLPPTGRIWERSKREKRCHSTCPPEMGEKGAWHNL